MAELKGASEWLAMRGSCMHPDCDICESHKRLYRDIQADAIEAAAREVIEWYGKHEELAGELLDRVRALKPEAK